MKPRFFSETKITECTVELHGSEHEHMTRVMRLRPGDAVILFDDSGDEFEATLAEVRRGTSRLTVESRMRPNRELSFDLTLAVALPKGERQQWLIEKCVELGVTRLVPLVTARGVAQPGERAGRRFQRWIVAASKQCRRNRLMQVGGPQQASQFFGQANAATVLVAHPTGPPESIQALLAPHDARKPAVVAIGPEGGFTQDELSLAQQAGCTILNLGPRILRVETAAVAIVAGLVLVRQGNQ